MNDNDQPEPVSKSPFWRFSIKFYAVPGVAQACIELQDQAGVDVNVLFFLLWNATQGRALNAEDVAAVEDAIRPWREMTVVPLRSVRRALKTAPYAPAARWLAGFGFIVAVPIRIGYGITAGEDVEDSGLD